MSIRANEDYIKLLPQTIVKNGIDSVQGKIWTASSNQYDDLDLMTAQTKFLTVIDKQSGVNLDLLGVLLGQLRNGLDDENYRIFLKVAIQRYISRGDIFSINQIGQSLGISPLNITENGNVLRLDGTWLLDGSELLEYSEKPATFSFNRNLSVFDDEGNNIAITEIIDAVRAAGIFADLYFNFTILTTQMYDYTQAFDGILDGTWVLDSNLALCGCDSKIFTPNYIAIGDGAQPGGTGPVRDPQPGDTGLQNEVLRKEVLTANIDGVRTHFLEINRPELDGVYINEIGLFWDTDVMLLGSFDSKLKNDVTRFIFRVKETQT